MSSDERRAHWGKRPREDANFTRFSELSPEQKMQRRKEERQEKKDRERTMAYFKSVHRMLEEVGSGQGDATAIVDIVDSFFVELSRLLREDPALHLLRNGFVCRTIEAALASSRLLHSKTLLYSFLGRLQELITSPVASYLLETLFASLMLALSALAAEGDGQLERELAEGGPGIHDGSGIPSTATVVGAAVEELEEQLTDLLVHEVGSRALRSILLVMGGVPIRGAPPLPHPVRLDAALGALARGCVSKMEEAYTAEYNLSSPAEAWIAAAKEPTTSFILQSLLRVCESGTEVDAVVRVRLEGLEWKRRTVLEHLLLDEAGCFVFQAYIMVPTAKDIITAGGNRALRMDPEAGKEARQMLRMLDDSDDDDEGRKTRKTDEELVTGCCWGRAMRLVGQRISQLLSPGSEHVQLASHVLCDLALHAPTALHLRAFWDQLVEPFLAQYLQLPALSPVLVALVRKCAFARSETEGDAAAAAAVGGSSSSLPVDINRALRKDEASRARLFPTPVGFQEVVCTQLCNEINKTCAKGAAVFLCTERRMGDGGAELARYLLHLAPLATARLQNSFEKLRHADVIALAHDRKGSLVLQQWLRASTARFRKESDGGKKRGSATSTAPPPALRFFRRLKDSVDSLIMDKYAAFVVEVVYEVGDMQTKELVVRSLIPSYERLKVPGAAEVRAAEGEAEVAPKMGGGDDEGGEGGGDRSAAGPAAQTPQSRRFVAAQVIKKCYVEQYVHRQEDWRKLAQRQCQVQQLLNRMGLTTQNL